jgi:hypothetical protein
MNDMVSVSDVSRWEAAVMDGNLEGLNPVERVELVRKVCESVGLNPLTGPLQYIRLSGKLTLYARRDATDQLRKIHKVSVVITNRETMEGVYVVTAKATMPDGRTDESTGAVAISNLKGEALANAFLKAETKAKRRVTLSICGLGFLDETEVQSVPDAQPVPMDFPAIQAPPKASKSQLDQILALAKSKGLNGDYFSTIKERFSIKSSAELTPEQADWVISDIQGRSDTNNNA